MSPLLRDELRVALFPDQIAVVGIRSTLTRRGLKRQMHIREAVPCAAAAEGEAGWLGAVKALDAALSRFGSRRTHATVILSNHFLHYALVPWAGALSNEEEEMAYARHCFKEIYGATSEAWDLRISSDKAGEPQLASAVETNLLSALRELFNGKGVNLRSIQPHLMAAYNSCRWLLRGRNAWVAFVEPGHLCLSLLRQGQWSRMKAMRIGENWREELPLILEREAFLASAETVTHEVFLWTTDEWGKAIPVDGKWRIQHMKPMSVHGFAPEHDGRFAVAMSRGD